MKKTLLKYANEYQWIVEYMLTKNNGSSIRNSVKIRELSEAELILATADYTILDQELVKENDRFFYRIHAIDNDSGEFEYHYYDNFDFVKKMYTSFKNNISDKEVTELSFLTSKNVNNPPTINYQTNVWLKQKKYQEVIDLLEKSDELTPIGRLNLARAYLYSKTEDKIDNLIDEIVNQKDLGDINAAIFIAELMIDFNGLAASQKDIEELLSVVDGRTKPGYGAFELAKIYFNLNNKAEFTYWSDVAINKNQSSFYPEIYILLKKEGDTQLLHKLLEKQHASGNLDATYHMALSYHDGQNVEVDHKKENELLLFTAEKGDVRAMHDFANNLINSEFIDVDVERALYWFRLAAAEGYGRAANQIGHIYYEGVGAVEVDYMLAMEWFQKASDYGNVFSTSNLGLFYQYGLGVKKDYEKALEYYRSSALKGDLKSFERLGDLYRDSFGEKYYKDAEYWYEQGALKGSVNCQYELVKLYAEKLENNDGVVYWSDLVSRSSDGQLIENLGDFYRYGDKFIEKNYERAFDLYEQAALLGNSTVNFDLAEMYFYGLGVDVNYSKALELFLLSDKSGNKESYFFLGYIYSEQTNTVYDYSLAVRYYEKAILLDDVKAMTNLATMFLEDENESTNKRAISLYTKAAELGYKEAQTLLGIEYEYGENVDVNIDEARRFYEMSASLESEVGTYLLAKLYEIEFGGKEKNIKRIFELLTIASKNGNELAHNDLARMYFYGESVEKNYLKAFELFNMAAQEDISDSFYFLGYLYLYGVDGGTNKNYEAAKKYFELAEPENNDHAAHKLAVMYSHGWGVEQDFNKAIYYFTLEANLDSSITDADYHIANMLSLESSQSEKNYSLAHKYFNKSVQSKNSSAMNNLAELYRLGKGVPIDYAKAIELYMQAIELGKGIAMLNMAELYRDGHGVQKNSDISVEWVKKSAGQGYEPAVEIVKNNYKGFKQYD